MNLQSTVTVIMYKNVCVNGFKGQWVHRPVSSKVNRLKVQFADKKKNGSIVSFIPRNFA